MIVKKLYNRTSFFVFSLLVLSVLLASVLLANAQNEEYAEKFELINAIKKFLVDSTACNIDTSKFYSNYNELEEGNYYYVYVSEKEKPIVAKGYSNFKYFGNDSSEAVKFINEIKEKDVSTFLYKTAGTSDAKLNAVLLSYFNEEIAFVVFHEAMHLYINSFNDKLPYIFVEALCDAFALSLLNRFYRSNSQFFNGDAVLNFTNAVNSVHSLIANALLNLKNRPNKYERVLKSVQDQISAFLVYSVFLKQRYAGEVNMAWMLKNKNYSGAYFYCKMFVGFPNTKIMTQTLSKVFGTDKNEYFDQMLQKESFLYIGN